MRKANFRNSDMLTPEMEKRFFDKLLNSMVESYVAYGGDIEGKTQKDVFEELFKHSPKTSVSIHWDHTSLLLNQARKFVKSEEYEIASIFYSTWFEHNLNHLIYVSCKKKHLDEKEIKNILRQANFEAKSTWLLKLLGLKKVNASHLSTIKKMNDFRNSFIHYKWPGIPDSLKAHKKMDNDLFILFENIEKTVRYINRLFNTQLYRGQSKKALALPRT